MWKSISRRTATWISIVILSYSVGCILSPQEDPAPPSSDPIEFKDLTEKEDVITNMLLSYQAKDYEPYMQLLLRPEDTYNGSTYANGYYWYNQPGAVGTELSILLGADLERTFNMFRAAEGDPVDKENHPVIYRLTLTLTEGSWSPITELWGEPCEDCWYTERQYDIFLEAGQTDYHGFDNVQFYIVPVDEDGKKIYKIAVAKDVLAQ
jgi:hypothetical protein